jgi:hypothetical protein
MITRTRRFLLVPVLAAFVLGLAGAAHASPGAATALLVDDDDRAYNAAQLGLRECDGGAQLSVHMRSSDTEVSIGENGAFVPLPGATYAFQVPNMATALVDVTFSAEGSLVGEQIPNLPPADFLQVVILLDGVWMHPDNDLAFSSQTYRADATQTCRRVGPGNHVVTVVWQLVDQGMANVLTGVLDDYELKVQLHA